MSKTTRRISVAVMTVSLAATTAFGVIKANSVYDDSNIGISSVLDRYVESVQLDTTEDTISAKTEEQTTTETDKWCDLIAVAFFICEHHSAHDLMVLDTDPSDM